MGTYWDEFINAYSWVTVLPLKQILELFWYYCHENKTLFSERITSARQEIKVAEQTPTNIARDKIAAIAEKMKHWYLASDSDEKERDDIVNELRQLRAL